MKTIFLDNGMTYDGTQLTSHWIFHQTGAIGDAVASFIGPADVPTTHMVDLVDVKNDEPIFSRSMLHFIVEHFDAELALAIARQRLLVAIAAEELGAALPGLRRRGNDLFSDGKKLSVAIATASPVSMLLHFGINIESTGTPVPTLGLSDVGVDPRALADAVMRRYGEEIASMAEARCKVRSVP